MCPRLERLEERDTPTIGLGSAFGLGSSGIDTALGVATDRLGNTYVTGYFANTVDFDPSAAVVNRTSNGLSDFFVAKYSRIGQLQWVTAIGGGNEDIGNDVGVDDAGNVFVTGYFSSGGIDFDPGAGSTVLPHTGGRDIFVAKYNGVDGTLLWGKSAGQDTFGSPDDEGIDLAVDAAGNVVVTGYFQNTVDFDPGAGIISLTSFGSADIFLWKFDGAGNFVTATRRGDFSDDRAQSIVSDRDGNFYVAGTYEGVIILDPDNNLFQFASEGASDVYLMKVDSNLRTIWGVAFGGSQNDGAVDVALDPMGNTLVAGYFRHAVDFDSGGEFATRVSAGSADAYVASYTSEGTFRNVVAFGGSGDEFIGGVVPLSGRTFAVAGQFAGTADFDPGRGVTTRNSVLGSYDGFVANYTLDGEFVWVKSFGGANYDIPSDIAAGPAGSTITVGSFGSTPGDFDPNAGTLNLSSNGFSDGFVLRLADRPDIISRNQLGFWGLAANNGTAFGFLTQAGRWNEKLKWSDTMTGDFNGDGRLDVLSRNSLGDWWLGAMNAQGRFVNRHWGRSDPKVPLKFVGSGDFTGGGLPDVCGFDANGYWHILVNTGTGFRDELREMWDDPATWAHATSGDFNGDGLTDLAGQNKLGEWWVSLNTGDGGFELMHWGQWTESLTWLDRTFADFNADGRLDVAGRTKTGGWFVGLAQPNNTFSFTNWGSWAAILSTIKAAFFGDFNGDGYLDVVGRTATNQLHLSAGNGTSFAAPTFWGTMAPAPITWAETLVGDYDGDGRDDLLGRTSVSAWVVARFPGVFTSSQWAAWGAMTWRDTRRGGFQS